MLLIDLPKSPSQQYITTLVYYPKSQHWHTFFIPTKTPSTIIASSKFHTTKMVTTQNSINILHNWSKAPFSMWLLIKSTIKEYNFFYIDGNIRMVMNIKNGYFKIKSSIPNIQISFNTMLDYLLFTIKTINLNTLKSLFVNSLSSCQSKDVWYTSPPSQLLLI